MGPVECVGHQRRANGGIDGHHRIVEYRTDGCVDSDALMVADALDDAIGYFKAGNTDINDRFGSAVSLSTDGNARESAVHLAAVSNACRLCLAAGRASFPACCAWAALTSPTPHVGARARRF